MQKKRLLISYHNLPAEVMKIIKSKYPHGYNHDLMEVKGVNNSKLFVLPVETSDTMYLVKVDLKKPIKMTPEVEEEEEVFTDEEAPTGEFNEGGDGFPNEEIAMEEDD